MARAPPRVVSTRGAASSERRIVARNAVASYAERALLMLSALLLTPYLFRQLGVAGFGAWSLVFTVATTFTVLELGVALGVTKYVADFRATDRPADRDAVVGAAVAVLGVVGVLALLVTLVLAQMMDGLVAPEERAAFRTGMAAVGIGLLVRFPCVAYGATLQGYERYDLSSAALATTSVVFAAGTILAVQLGYDVAGVATAYAASLAAGGVAFAVCLRRVAPDLPLRPRLRTARRGELLRFGSFALLADSMVFVGQRMDVVVVAALRGASAAAPLAAASKLQSGLQALTLPFIALLMPMTAGLWSRGEHQEVARRLVLTTRATVQLSLPLVAWLALFSQDVVDLWLGAEAPGVTATIVTVLAVQTLFLAAVPAEKVLVAIGRVRTIGLLNTAEGLLNITLSIILVATTGVLGAALGSLLASAALGPLKVPIACRAIGRPVGDVLREALLAPVLSTVPALAAMVLLFLTLEPGPVRLVLGLAATVVLAAGVAARQVGPGRLRTAVRRRGRPSVHP